MMLGKLLTAIVLSAAAPLACGQTSPAAPPAGPPAAAQNTPAPAVMALLEALEAAGAKHATIQADVNHLIERMLTGETEQRTGYVKYQKRTAKTPDKFRIHFDTLRMDEGRKLKSVVDYGFDGMWLSVAKHRIRQLTRYQVAAPGERVQPLRLGKGPFPLPFGQDVADILEYFKVTQPARKASKLDPKNADCLRFTTLASRKTEMAVVWMDQWIDRTTHLPVKIVAYDKNRNKTTVVFTNITSGVTFDKSVFTIPQQRGWKPVIIQPFRKDRAAAPGR